MHLSSLRIRNYRSVATEQTIELPNGLSIVGPNNSGKTNVLRATALFFTGVDNHLGYFRASDLSFGKNAEQRGSAVGDGVAIGAGWQRHTKTTKSRRPLAISQLRDLRTGAATRLAGCRPGSRRVRAGLRPGSCSRRRSEPGSTPRTCVPPFAARWHWSRVLTLASGHRGTCGARSSRSCRPRGSRSREIARLVGHSGTDVTEKVYRQELRPVIQAGAQVMDAMSADVGTDVGWSMAPLFSVAVARGAKGA